ncbi:MAG: sigma-54-dependent Fis family transcriptional regulator [Candidatus Aminicenantes bacterium]|nr:sigma-54-dependent Fis family transcriptional regulator [Candidatus Aminicenantes bacterium]
MTLRNPVLPILLVDDEAAALKSFEFALNSLGWDHVLAIQDSREVLPLLKHREVEMLILDLTMPGVSGTEILECLSLDHPEIPVIVATGLNDVKMAVQCMKMGAADYLLKPVEKGRLEAAVNHVLEMRTLKRQNRLLKERLLMEPGLEHPEAFEAIVTRNPRMCAVFRYLEAVAASREPILITGATGTGKELLARSIHALGEGPFVAVNVAGLDDQMFSDTLFGHRRGAFTDAVQQRDGLVEQAGEGVLFLDEIGDLNPQSQVKLLRLIQEREYYPLGADVPRRSGARVVVATNTDLRRRMEKKEFRRDLYYRLSVHHVHLPPLTERREDIPLLAEAFIRMAAEEMGKPVPTVPPELETLLRTYHFPGNIRELRSMVIDAVGRHRSRVLSLEAFREAMARESGVDIVEADPQEDDGCIYASCRRIPTVREAESMLIKEAMRRAENNQSIAARLLGISRQTLNSKLKKFHSGE